MKDLGNKDIIIGNGVIGSAICELLASIKEVCCWDIDSSKCVGNPVGLFDVVHVCFPFDENFIHNVICYAEWFEFKELVIHSTVKPRTTVNLQKLFSQPIVFSPVRGVHGRMLKDLRRYTKFYASEKEASYFVEEMKKAGVKTERWSSTTCLELAKVLMGTSYYGWLIVFAQRVKILADKYGVDENELWVFTEEIHEFLGNRPRMFSGEGIGGHCILSNLELLGDELFYLIRDHDRLYRVFLYLLKHD